MGPTQRYAVIGDPVEHSLSPVIHTAFAQQCGIALEYHHQRITPNSFNDDVNEFFAAGGSGLNVTMPLKSLAFDYADLISDRAMNAAAANTLKFLNNDVVLADNTDGVGLVADLGRLGVNLAGAHILLLGSGGAARGCVEALLRKQPEAFFVHNRTEENARTLIQHSARLGELQLLGDGPASSFDVVINATSASMAGTRPEVDPSLLKNAVCYDLTYGDKALPFTKWALSCGAQAAHDGLGMLIEQAAASFLLWHDVQPDTTPVHQMLAAREPKTR